MGKTQVVVITIEVTAETPNEALRFVAYGLRPHLQPWREAHKPIVGQIRFFQDEINLDPDPTPTTGPS